MNKYRIIVDTSTANYGLQKYDLCIENLEAKDIYAAVKIAFQQKWLYGAVKLTVEETKHLI
jgi:hypothetical protein